VADIEGVQISPTDVHRVKAWLAATLPTHTLTIETPTRRARGRPLQPPYITIFESKLIGVRVQLRHGKPIQVFTTFPYQALFIVLFLTGVGILLVLLFRLITRKETNRLHTQVVDHFCSNWPPLAPETPVLVQGSDGETYPGAIVQPARGGYICSFPNGQQQWCATDSLRPG
jgi:hypothetical protein